MEETLSAWSAARPALAAPASQLVGVYTGCMYHEYLSITVAAGGKPPSQVSAGCGWAGQRGCDGCTEDRVV